MTQQETIKKVARQLRALAEELDGLDVRDDVMLPVPYLSQWGPEADKRRGDCGPATVAMTAHRLTIWTPTVDEAADACGQPRWGKGSFFTTLHQLKNGLHHYGVEGDFAAPWRQPQLSLILLREMIDEGKPSIALIDYKALREETNKIPVIVHNQDQGYNFGHFVLFVGYSAKGVYIHDPDFWDDREDEGAFRWVPNEPFAKALASPALGNTYGSSGVIIP